jgi:hypothetical protein
MSAVGFNYEFNALNATDKPNELNQAFSVMFSAGQQMSIVGILKSRFPFLRWIVSSPLRPDIDCC